MLAPNPNEALYFFGLAVAEAVSDATSTRIRLPLGKPRGYPWESPGATPGKAQGLTLALRHAHCHDAWRTHGPKGRSGRAAGHATLRAGPEPGAAAVVDKSLFGVILLLFTRSFCKPTQRRRRLCTRLMACSKGSTLWRARWTEWGRLAYSTLGWLCFDDRNSI